MKLDLPLSPIEFGKGRIISKGKDIAIISIGSRLKACIDAAAKYEKEFKSKVTIVDARFAKPLDEELIINIAKKHKIIITVEEGCIGGFGSHVNHLLNSNKLLNKITIKNLIYPDKFLDQDTQDAMHEIAGMSEDQIYELLCDTNSHF